MREEKTLLFDILGVLIFIALVCSVLAGLAGAFWIVFCHPGSKMVELIPFLRPARITVTCILAFSCYQFLANPARGTRAANRLMELVAVLLLSALLGSVRFFYGTGDGSTVADLSLDTAVRWSMCLGLTMPMAAFALLGYRAGRQKSLPEPVSTEVEDEDAALMASRSYRLRDVGIRILSRFA